MESDVPLIEMAGEDDSLLQLVSGEAVSGTNNTGKSTIDDAYFFCSPLQPRRSKASEGVMVNEMPRKPSSPLCRDGVNKENTNTNNTNKVDELKLSLQPQQMKKKKKGGGYNLRKSLAWDRAFFTDEGVLNSEELSRITGNASSNGLLSVIHEDESCMTDSAGQHVIEEKLFKGLPESPSNNMRIVGGSPLTKHDSAAKRKVPADRDIGRSGSKRSGCPRPVGSSSLKRPANVNTMKSPMKEPRASRLPVPKPNSSLLPRTSKSLTVGANDLKRNQIAHPVKSNTTRSGPNNAKVSPTGKSFTSKSSVQQAKRNVASGLVKGSLTKIHCPPAIDANNALEGIPKVALPSTSHASYGRNERSKKDGIPQVTSKQALPLTGRALHGRLRRTAAPEVMSKQALPPTSHASHGREEGSRKTAVRLPDTGVNSLCTQLPTSKPSGLRMPSPSLGFFHQSKASSSPSPLKTISQPCINPNLKKVDTIDTIHELRPLSSLGKKLNVIIDTTMMGNSNGKCSILGSDVLSAVNHVTMDEVEPFLEVKSCPKVELNIQSSSSSYDMTENQLKFNSILVHEDQHSTGQAKPDINEKVLHMEDVESQTNDNEFILQRGLCEQLEMADKSVEVGFVLAPKSKDRDKPHVASHPSSAATFPGSSGKCDINDHQLLEDEPNALSQKNPGVILKFNSEAASSSSSMLTSNNDLVSGDLNINELDTQEGDLLKLWACEGNRICDEDPMVCEKDVSLTKDFQVSEEIQTYSFQKVADVSPKFQNASSFELKTSDIWSSCRFEDQDKDGSTFDKKSGNPHVEGAQKVALGGKKPERLDFQSSSSIDEQVYQENILQLDDSILDEISIVPEESKHANSLQYVDLKEPEGTGSCRSEPEVSRILSHDCRSNVAEIVESQNVDNVVLLPEDNKIVVTSYNLDSQLNNQCRDHSLELESDEIRITGVVTSHNVDAGFSEGGDFKPQLNVKVQVESASGVDDVIEDKGSGTKNCIVQFESCPAPIVNLPADGPVIKLPEDAPSIKLPSDAPVIKLPEDAPVIKLPEDAPAIKLPADAPVTKLPADAPEDAPVVKLPADAPVVKLPADAVPFSDEWLAALEAAGEEILTKKSGAVQNSPPNKSEPEVGPWSPVKRKANQVIGPFDCTKHTNNPPGSL